MKDRPILFSGPMVRALLDGSKTQTRRVVKLKSHQQIEERDDGTQWPWMYDGERDADCWLACPYGQAGQRLWVRETFYAWGHWTKRLIKKKGREEWHFVDETLGSGNAYRYEADEKLPRRKRELHEVGWWKRPAIFMPLAASRITLEITSVRVERLQDITRGDAMSEGCPFPNMATGDDPRKWYADLWNQLNGPAAWDANPWVWVVEFRRLP